MPQPSTADGLLYALAGVVGVGLITLARWATRREGGRALWLALPLGDLRLTEVVGAFLVGACLGSIIAPQFDGGLFMGRGRMIGPVARFGPIESSRLPAMLGLAVAALDALLQIDVVGLLLRGSPPQGALNMYLGWEARVVSAIPAGGVGQILLRGGS